MRPFFHSHFLIGLVVAALIVVVVRRPIPHDISEEAVEDMSDTSPAALLEVALTPMELPERATSPNLTAEAGASPQTEEERTEPAADHLPSESLDEAEDGDFARTDNEDDDSPRLPGIDLRWSADVLRELIRRHDCHLALYDVEVEEVCGVVDPYRGTLEPLDRPERFSPRVILLEASPSWSREAEADLRGRSLRPLLLLSRDVAADLSEAQVTACRLADRDPAEVRSTVIALRPELDIPFVVQELQ